MKPRFRADSDGILADVPADEAELLEVIPQLLHELDPEDPAFARIHPAAYPADPAADREFRRLVAGDADAARREDQIAFLESLGRATSGAVLSRSETDAWLRVLGEARLVLAVRLGIEIGDEEIPDPDTSLAGFYDYLSWLQGQLVEAAADRLESA